MSPAAKESIDPSRSIGQLKIYPLKNRCAEEENPDGFGAPCGDHTTHQVGKRSRTHFDRFIQAIIPERKSLDWLLSAERQECCVSRVEGVSTMISVNTRARSAASPLQKCW